MIAVSNRIDNRMTSFIYLTVAFPPLCSFVSSYGFWFSFSVCILTICLSTCIVDLSFFLFQEYLVTVPFRTFFACIVFLYSICLSFEIFVRYLCFPHLCFSIFLPHRTENLRRSWRQQEFSGGSVVCFAYYLICLHLVLWRFELLYYDCVLPNMRHPNISS